MSGAMHPESDLSMVFVDTDETLYVDTCGHVNGPGNRILAEAVAKAASELY